mgnify:CR=1 FL=1
MSGGSEAIKVVARFRPPSAREAASQLSAPAVRFADDGRTVSPAEDVGASHTVRTERRAARKAVGDDDSEEAEPVEIESTVVRCRPACEGDSSGRAIAAVATHSTSQ